MSVPALVDDFAPEVQLTLTLEEAASTIKSMKDAGLVASDGTSLSILGEITYDQADALGAAVGLINRSCQWWTGDLLNYAEGAFGEEFAQLAGSTGLAEQTLLNRQYVCKHVPPSRRRAALSFSIHADVASLSAREQVRWLDRAEKHGWKRAELRAQMKAKRKDERPTLIDDDNVELGAVLEAVRSLVANAEVAGENVICRVEDFARVKAAIGEED